jgi:hypothetical protein
MTDENVLTIDPEITAISEVYTALRALDSDAQSRVLKYVAEKLGIRIPSAKVSTGASESTTEKTPISSSNISPDPIQEEEPEDLEGVSPVAKRWIARNDLNEKALSELFSLGVDEIDLITKKVPGKTKKDRMHNVFLLKGVAAYLGTGTYKFSHEQVKEACVHYGAFDTTNFASYLKSLSSDIAGTKDSGYSLTARGQAAATALVKELTQKS